MNGDLRAHGQDAIRLLDAAIAMGPGVTHDAIRQAVLPVVALRDRAIQLREQDACDQATLDRANTILSLVYGALFPLAGVHLDRLDQARGEIASLINHV